MRLVDSLKSAAIDYGLTLTFDAKNVSPFRRVIGLSRQVLGCDVHEQLWIVPNSNRLSLLLRLSVVPGANQWRGSFVHEEAGFDENTEPQWILQQLREFRETELTSFLESTMSARAAAAFYVEHAPANFHDPHDCRTAFEASVSDERLFEVRKMLRWDLLTMAYSTERCEELELDACKCAVHLICGLAQRADSPFAANLDPYLHRDLAICIQILASHSFHGSHPK